MARPRNRRYKERTSQRERETPCDQPRSDHRRRDDRSYERQDDSIRPRDGDRRRRDGRDTRDSSAIDLIVILPLGGIVMRSLSFMILLAILEALGAKDGLVGVEALQHEHPLPVVVL